MFRLRVYAVFFGCAMFVFAPILIGQKSDETVWKVKGARLRISSEKITYEAKKYAPLSIATNAVTSVCYDTAIHARGPSEWQATEAMGSARGGIILAPLVIPVIAGIHASKVTRHFIILHWTAPEPVEDLPSPTLTVEAEKGNYTALLKELQQRTGKTWSDVGQHRRDVYTRFGNELKAAEKEKHAPYLDIKEKSRLGNSLVEPYSYRFVLRTHSSDQGNLYLFAGEKADRRLVAVVNVVIRDEVNKDKDATAIYKTQHDSPPQVSGIRVPTSTLTVSQSQPYEYNPDCPSLP